jgi:hypothetical protein
MKTAVVLYHFRDGHCGYYCNVTAETVAEILEETDADQSIMDTTFTSSSFSRCGVLWRRNGFGGGI